MEFQTSRTRQKWPQIVWGIFSRRQNCLKWHGTVECVCVWVVKLGHRSNSEIYWVSQFGEIMRSCVYFGEQSNSHQKLTLRTFVSPWRFERPWLRLRCTRHADKLQGFQQRLLRKQCWKTPRTAFCYAKTYEILTKNFREHLLFNLEPSTRRWFLKCPYCKHNHWKWWKWGAILYLSPRKMEHNRSKLLNLSPSFTHASFQTTGGTCHHLSMYCTRNISRWAMLASTSFFVFRTVFGDSFCRGGTPKSRKI